jgi:hypothetical protein
MEFLDNGQTYNTLPASKGTFYIVLKSHTPYYIHKTFRKQPTEEESSNFGNVWCTVLQDNEILCFHSYQYYTLPSSEFSTECSLCSRNEQSIQLL